MTSRDVEEARPRKRIGRVRRGERLGVIKGSKG